jgi:trehalose/maltose hydrolase-like predicted phosphorylase
MTLTMVASDAVVVDNKTISDFQTTYDFKAGVLVWSYKWTPQGNKGYDPLLP